MAAKTNNSFIQLFANEEFDQLIQSMPGIMWVDTLEEERFITEIMDDVRDVRISSKGLVGKQKRSISVWLWSLTSGLHEITEEVDSLMVYKIDQETTNPIKAIENIIQVNIESKVNIFIMRGLGDLIKMQPAISRKLKDVYKLLYANNKVIIATATNNEIPLSLDKNITYFSHKTMNKDQLSSFINTKLSSDNAKKLAKEKNIKINYTKEEMNDINNSFLGLGNNEVRKLLNLEFNKRGKIYPEDVIKEKKRAIEKSGVLEYWDKVELMDNVGGLNRLKNWLNKRKNSLSQDAIDFGLPIPRGMLVVGPPGVGKSLTAKAVASEWKLPLIRMDVGKLMGSLVGQSESNIRKALSVLDSNQPCICWIDEVEKNLSGSASSNQSDSGTLSRVFGTITTWLQEKETYVFVILTANNISELPPELTRKGRLDEIWYVGLPTENEKKEIFSIQIKKYNRNPKKFDIDKLAKINHISGNEEFKYTGAEIEEAIKDAMYTAFDEIESGTRKKEKDFTTEDVKNSLLKLTPISKSEKERINKIIKEGEKRYANASSEVSVKRMSKKNVSINL